MTKTPVIIKDAYREGNLMAEQQELTAEKLAEGLRVLNRVIAGVYGFEVGDPLYDWPIGREGYRADVSWTEQDWMYLLQNVRMVTAQAGPQTVYLPPNPDDGARVALVDPQNRLAAYPITIMGNGRNIEGSASLLLNTDDITRIWLYRADLGEWVRLSDLTGDADEDFPFPAEFDDFFITRLAMRVNPRYGRSMDEQTVAALEKAQRNIRARYRQTQLIPADLGVLALTGKYGDGVARADIVNGRLGWMR